MKINGINLADFIPNLSDLDFFLTDTRFQLKGALFDEKMQLQDKKNFNRLFQRAPGGMRAAVFS